MNREDRKDSEDEIAGCSFFGVFAVFVVQLLFHIMAT
jgi:hypothetical protein